MKNVFTLKCHVTYPFGIIQIMTFTTHVQTNISRGKRDSLYIFHSALPPNLRPVFPIPEDLKLRLHPCLVWYKVFWGPVVSSKMHRSWGPKRNNESFNFLTNEVRLHQRDDRMTIQWQRSWFDANTTLTASLRLGLNLLFLMPIQRLCMAQPFLMGLKWKKKTHFSSKKYLRTLSKRQKLERGKDPKT